MKAMGSQFRETVEEAGVSCLQTLPNGEAVVLEGGQLNLYMLNDDFAGYVLEIAGKGYEFVRTLTQEEYAEYPF